MAIGIQERTNRSSQKNSTTKFVRNSKYPRREYGVVNTSTSVKSSNVGAVDRASQEKRSLTDTESGIYTIVVIVTEVKGHAVKNISEKKPLLRDL